MLERAVFKKSMVLITQFIKAFASLCLVTVITYCLVFRSTYYISNDQMYASNKLQPGQIETDGRMNCSTRKVPNVIIQYGSQRTATTLQFQILCLIMALLHGNESNTVGCYYSRVFKKRIYKYTVIKTHALNNFIMDLPPDAWVFLTSSKSLSNSKKINFEWTQREIIQRNLTIPFVADVDFVSKRGYYVVYEYQSIFGLSDAQIQYLLEYLRFWEILRKCCGVQMSYDWRNRLSPSPNYSQHHDTHSPTYPACEMYNISKVEYLMRKTYIFEKFSDVISLHRVIGKPSNSDGQLDGTYCQRCQDNIIKNNIRFNKPCT